MNEIGTIDPARLFSGRHTARSPSPGQWLRDAATRVASPREQTRGMPCTPHATPPIVNATPCTDSTLWEGSLSSQPFLPAPRIDVCSHSCTSHAAGGNDAATEPSMASPVGCAQSARRPSRFQPQPGQTDPFSSLLSHPSARCALRA